MKNPNKNQANGKLITASATKEGVRQLRGRRLAVDYAHATKAVEANDKSQGDQRGSRKKKMMKGGKVGKKVQKKCNKECAPKAEKVYDDCVKKSCLNKPGECSQSGSSSFC